MISNIDLAKFDYTQSPFEHLRHEDKKGEYWLAREIFDSGLSGYAEWQYFLKGPISRAMNACTNSGERLQINFVELHKNKTGDSRGRVGVDYRLSRYACYLIFMNGDPKIKEIALAQTYFAYKTRQAEVSALVGQDNYITIKAREYKPIFSEEFRANCSRLGLNYAQTTRECVYGPLGLLDAFDKVNPQMWNRNQMRSTRQRKNHSHANNEDGSALFHIGQMIGQTVLCMKISRTREEFKDNYNKLVEPPKRQLTR